MRTAEEEEQETEIAHSLMHHNATSALLRMQVDCVAWINLNLVDAGYAGTRVTLKSDGDWP